MFLDREHIAANEAANAVQMPLMTLPTRRQERQSVRGPLHRPTREGDENRLTRCRHRPQRRAL